MSVLPPGQGENLVGEKEDVSPSFTSQLDMFRLLPGALNDLTTSMLTRFYKPMDFVAVSHKEIQRIDKPIPGVTIVRDKTYEVPRVFGATRRDAMFGAGYAQAQSLLWQMEVNRHTWYGTLASLMGTGKDGENLSSDAVQFRVLDYSEGEYRAMYEHLRTEYGYWGRQAYEDLQSYVDGINAYVADIRSTSRPLPVEFQQRGLTPSRWTPLDVIASSAWSHVRGLSRGLGPREAGNAIMLRRLRNLFGEVGGDQVYADLRDAGDPETPRIIPSSRRFARSSGQTDQAGLALIDAGSFVPRSALASSDGTDVSAASQFISAPPSKSNALLVASRISATGHPLSIQGPQDKYGFPHNYDFEIQIVGPDLEARGSLEFHGPYPYNGARGHNFAFSGTAQYIDQFDMYAELLCEPNGSKPTLQSTHYLYHGRCIALKIRERFQELPGGAGSYTFRSIRSVHGPIIGQATVNGRPVVLSQARSTLFHEEAGLPALAQVFVPSVVQSARTFIDVMARSPRQLAYYYVDGKDIAFVNPGLVPIRAVGMRPDLPAWGTGEWDWQGFDPREIYIP
jgi:acyl-homoserine lactone acylase PvdQ